MTKRTRTILFLGLLFLFIILAPSIIFYSWGYRFNFETKAIVKTGAFYFKVLPKSAQISIAPLDSKGNVVKEKGLTKKTDFFFGATLIENLLPKKYEVEITKDGFYSWKKNLEIKENQVIESKNIVLIPKDAGTNLLTQNVEDLFPSPDEKMIILKELSETSTSSQSSATSSSWALKIFEVQNNVKSQLMDAQDISKDSSVSLLDLKFSPDSKRLLLKTRAKQQVKYYFLDLNQSSPKPVLLDFLTEEYQDIFFRSNDSQKLILLKNGAVFEADIVQKKISAKILENIKSLQMFGDNFYYLDNSGFIFKTDSSFSSQEKINNILFPLAKNLSYQINILSGWVFLNDGQNLYFLNSDSASFENLFETKKEPKISPDFKKIVYYSDYEISLLFLKPELGQPPKQTGEKVFIGRFSEKVDEVFWLTSNYLIFNNAGKIKIAEIDDRDVINTVDLANFESPELFWSQNFKKLFILSNGDFYSSAELVP